MDEIINTLATNKLFLFLSGLSSIISLFISLFIAQKVMKITYHDSQNIKKQTQNQSGHNNQQAGRDTKG